MNVKNTGNFSGTGTAKIFEVVRVHEHFWYWYGYGIFLEFCNSSLNAVPHSTLTRSLEHQHFHVQYQRIISRIVHAANVARSGIVPSPAGLRHPGRWHRGRRLAGKLVQQLTIRPRLTVSNYTSRQKSYEHAYISTTSSFLIPGHTQVVL